MDINEALQVVNSLFDYLSEIGELDKEDFHRMNEAEDVINNYVRKTAAADVEPAIHGRWYDEDSFRLTQQEGGLHYAPIYRCSVCNKTVADNYISEHKYCLHCGAKMD